MSDNLAEYLRWSMRLLKGTESPDIASEYTMRWLGDAEKQMTQSEYDDAQRILAIIDEELV